MCARAERVSHSQSVSLTLSATLPVTLSRRDDLELYRLPRTGTALTSVRADAGGEKRN